MIPKTIADAWITAFNAQQLDKLLALYDNNAIHFSPKLKIRKPETNGLITGKVALREWWADAFKRLPTLHYQPILILTNHANVFIQYLRTVNGEEEMMVGEVLNIENGLIFSSRVYHS
jgi:hypothetical protein